MDHGMDFGNEEKEEEEKPEFAQGVLSRLSVLERRDRGRALREERRERLRERRELLRARIRELQQRRERLRERLRHPAGIPSDPGAVLSWKLRELRQRLRLFSLTGISGKLCRGGASFSFHPSFEGSVLRPFHLELLEKREHRPENRESRPENRESRPENRELRLGRHSIPAFIPLERLRREFLPGRLRLFLGILFRHLNAVVARREQLRRAQEEFPDCIQGIPCSNSLYNLLSFRYRIPGKKPGIPGENSEIPGENSEIPGEKMEIPEDNEEISVENSKISGENSEISRKIGEIPRGNAEISGKNSQIPGENEEFSGKSEGFSGKSGIPGKNPPEFWVRLRYGDPLRSLPTDVEISAHAPPEHRELFRSLSLPRALGALTAAHSRKIPEFPTGSG
ncbi:centromere protein O isoform X2 [Taeniopygia guttata]|uniref:centromere protein O isoform X2 n=1 Tax=Taeniopygia guttata TaxID=59729 RepID=UPI003BB8676F